MFQITFQQEAGEDVIVSANAGANILQLAQDSDVSIDAPCSGNGTCGKCQVRLMQGEVGEDPHMRISQEAYAAGWRLACQCTVSGTATFFVPSSAKAFMHDIRTADFSSKEELQAYQQSIDAVFQSGFSQGCKIEVTSMYLEEPTLDDPRPDNERLWTQLQAQYGDIPVILPNLVMQKLPHILREHAFALQCILQRSENELVVLDVAAPNEQLIACGLAVDIGTTTVSAALLNLHTGEVMGRASAGNHQIRFGADVINRIIQSEKKGGTERLQKAICEETLVPLLETMCQHTGIAKTAVVRVVIAANTTMNHLCAGVPASSIRMEPYVPVFREFPALQAYALGLPVHPEASVIFAPNVGSYVGGDITAGTLMTMLWNRPEFSLFIDLGTNGELVFGNEDFMMCCACSAGPAFEGGDITFGMRATTGAIEACTIDADTMEPTLTVIGSANTPVAGLCGSGIIDTISELFRCGIINAKGKFSREGKRVVYDTYGASYVLAFAHENGGEKDITLSEIDIDNFIRAKGAIYSAISTMLSTMDMTKDDIHHVYIAGGIGSGINLKKAISIGMLPDLSLDRYSYIGNSSLMGACAMLLSDAVESQVTAIGRGMTYIELSAHPGYMDEFVAACFLPHTDAGLFPAADMML